MKGRGSIGGIVNDTRGSDVRTRFAKEFVNAFKDDGHLNVPGTVFIVSDSVENLPLFNPAAAHGAVDMPQTLGLNNARVLEVFTMAVAWVMLGRQKLELLELGILKFHDFLSIHRTCKKNVSQAYYEVPMDPGLTDEQLVAQVLLNKDQFRCLVERYQHKLMRYIFRIGGKDAGEDLLQEVFINAYQNLSGFDQSLSFSAWIYRIAHNVVISHYRKQRIRPEGNLHVDGEDILTRLYSEGDVEMSADVKIDGERLHKAMGGLKPLYRDILVLRYFEQFEYQEISDVLKIPMGSVAVYLHRAKKQLKTLYDKQ